MSSSCSSTSESESSDFIIFYYKRLPSKSQIIMQQLFGTTKIDNAIYEIRKNSIKKHNILIDNEFN